MVYNSRSQEEDSGREQKREQAPAERFAEKSQEFAAKIAKCLVHTGKVSASIVQCKTANTDIKKICLELGTHSLTVKHRGYSISAECENPSALSTEFRQWCRANMSHVTKIDPRSH